jgi:hypothetical protein
MATAASHDADPMQAGQATGSGLSAEVDQAEDRADGPMPVSPQELNAWRRGFTPQAEIWNGRLAMLGLSVGLTVLLIARLIASHS